MGVLAPCPGLDDPWFGSQATSVRKLDKISLEKMQNAEKTHWKDHLVWPVHICKH